MSDNLPEKHRPITDLSKQERVNLAQECFISKAKHGTSFAELGRRHNMTPQAVRTLHDEYGLYLSKTRNHSKESGLVVYDYIINKGVEVLDNMHEYPAIVQAKAFEGVIQGQTRKDKLLGHEAPNVNVNAGGETLMDLVKQKYGGGAPSAADTAIIGEAEFEILDGEENGDYSDDEDTRLHQ
jgi:cyanate lyase